MNLGQIQPYYFPYSFLDWGLTVVALIVMGIMAYLVFRLALTQHKSAVEFHQKTIEVLDRLLIAIREVSEAVHTQVQEVAELRADVHRNRRLIEELESEIEQGRRRGAQE